MWSCYTVPDGLYLFQSKESEESWPFLKDWIPFLEWSGVTAVEILFWNSGPFTTGWYLSQKRSIEIWTRPEWLMRNDTLLTLAHEGAHYLRGDNYSGMSGCGQFQAELETWTLVHYAIQQGEIPDVWDEAIIWECIKERWASIPPYQWNEIQEQTHRFIDLVGM